MYSTPVTLPFESYSLRAIWTQAERAILEPHLAAFREADKAGRKQLLGTTVIPDLYVLHPTLDERDKAALKQVSTSLPPHLMSY